jgi:hypothetical protein
MTARALAATTAISILSLLACSSDETGDAAAGTGGAATTSSATGSAGGGGDPTPAASCKRPGDEGNDKGVGEYCTPGGGECSGFAEAGLCLADVGQDQWFCTRIGCDETTDCGEGAGCHVEEGAGSACVPCACDDTPVACGGGGGAGGGSGGAGGAGGAGGG